MDIALATRNRNKILEIEREIPKKFRLRSVWDLDSNFSDQIPETGKTLKENATQKARFICNRYHLPSLADDTGLEVASLGGAPGVFSARYAGEYASDKENIEKLLRELESYEDRSARFTTYICLIIEGKEHFFSGTVEGSITKEWIGTKGFGYDPIFKPSNPGNLTFSQMSLSEKNRISHRGVAVRKVAKFLKNQS